MKTGTAIALAIGVPAVVGLVIWGVTANRIIDKIDDVKPGGGGGGTSLDSLPAATPPEWSSVNPSRSQRGLYHGFDWTLTATDNGAWLWMAEERGVKVGQRKGANRMNTYDDARTELVEYLQELTG